MTPELIGVPQGIPVGGAMAWSAWLGETLSPLGTDAHKGLQSGVGSWGPVAGQDGGVDPAHPGLVRQGQDHDPVAVDDDGQVVGEGDSPSGGDEGLDLDRLIASAGQ
jgi:hypothetical protein